MATTDTGRSPVAARRAGYVIGATVNALLLWFVDNLLEWDVASFLTQDFERVSGIVSLSLLAGVVANLAYIYNDEPWVKSLGSMATTGFGFVASVRMWQVFPFDFSTYDTNWGFLVRVLLFVAIVGGAIGFIFELVKFLIRLGSPR